MRRASISNRGCTIFLIKIVIYPIHYNIMRPCGMESQQYNKQ